MAHHFLRAPALYRSNNLGDGNHVVEIIAQDNSGNKNLSPASFTWNVIPVQQGTTVTNTTITTPMTTNIGDTMINSITDGSNNAITNETTTPSITIRFEFSSVNVENLNHFECSMDGWILSRALAPLFSQFYQKVNMYLWYRF